jgi:hypothetical protein
MFTGAPDLGFTAVPGVRVHGALLSATMQETLTLWLNDPEAVTWKLTTADVDPLAALTLAGDGVVRPKLTTCKIRGKVCVM